MLWLYRLIFTPFPLAEVMTLAWHGHYATSQAKVNSPELMLAQNNALRELWRAPISKLHRRMLSDPAMRRWLDGLNSTKSHPNENLGREFLELFALGEGHYSERDVREASRALTGWSEVDFQKHRDQLDPGEFDDGTKTILGETGPWGLDDLVRIACRQPAAATHIARRLYRTFIADTDRPTDALLAPLADAMRVQGRRRRRARHRDRAPLAALPLAGMPRPARQESRRLCDRHHPGLRAVCAAPRPGRPGDPSHQDGPAAFLSAQRGRLARRTGLAGWPGAGGPRQFRGLDYRIVVAGRRGPFRRAWPGDMASKRPRRCLDSLATLLLGAHPCSGPAHAGRASSRRRTCWKASVP